MMAEERHLCAGCGAEIRSDYWQPPETSLCPECEDTIREGLMSWAGLMSWPGPKHQQAGDRIQFCPTGS